MQIAPENQKTFQIADCDIKEKINENVYGNDCGFFHIAWGLNLGQGRGKENWSDAMWCYLQLFPVNETFSPTQGN